MLLYHCKFFLVVLLAVVDVEYIFMFVDVRTVGSVPLSQPLLAWTSASAYFHMPPDPLIIMIFFIGILLFTLCLDRQLRIGLCSCKTGAGGDRAADSACITSYGFLITSMVSAQYLHSRLVIRCWGCVEQYYNDVVVWVWWISRCGGLIKRLVFLVFWGGLSFLSFGMI